MTQFFSKIITGQLSTHLWVTKQVPGYEHGNFIGPTIISNVTADMECYKVLSVAMTST